MVYSCIENDYPLTLVKEEVNNYGKKKERKFHLQMDEILKRLFTLKNTIANINFQFLLRPQRS